METSSKQRRNLPPLLALRAFEAAGRHLSFTKAADELCVTQGAVSRQIRLLENFLHRKLFDRHSRGIAFTDFGHGYFLEMLAAFAIIEQATPSKKRLSTQIITLNVMQSLAVLWLFPLLSKFSAAHSEIELRIITSMEPADLETDDADIAIRLGRLPGKTYSRRAPTVDFEMVTSWRGIHAELLAADVLTPVCAPSLIVKPSQKRPDEASPYCLLHNFNRPKCWHEWFHSQGIRNMKPAKDLEFGHFFTAFEAAREGLGFAILPSLMLSNISSDELVLPFKSAIPSAGEYYVLCKETQAEEPALRTVINWLKKQAQSATDVAAR